MRQSAFVAITLLALVAARCQRRETSTQQPREAAPPAATTTAAASAAVGYPQEIAAWQAKRLAGLTKEDGWLSLVGLYWLKEGSNRLSSDPKADVVVPETSGMGGNLVLNGGAVTFYPNLDGEVSVDGKPRSNAPVSLKSDRNGAQPPTIVSSGSVSFFVIDRNGKVGIRVKDRNSEARTKFAGLHYFPTDEKWRVNARFEPYTPPKKVHIVNVLGMESEEQSPGVLVFPIDGKEYRLEPILETGEKDYFLIIKDATSGKETYPAARYLYVKPPGPDGMTVVDFNKAYNPPCAFTHFATCPLPPAQNRLPIRITAGEKTYEGPH